MVFKPQGMFEGFQKKMNMPRDFAFVNRIQWGVVSILSILGAAGNWHRIEREFVFGDPPATPMGEQIADWRARWLERRALQGHEIYATPDGIASAGQPDEPPPLSV